MKPALGLALLLALVGPLSAYDPIIDSPMYKLPELPAQPVEVVFPDGAIALWLKALQRADADTKCKAADAIALAQRRGVKGLDATVAPLVTEFDREGLHPAPRLAVARALVTLDAREAAPSLFRQSQAGESDLRDAVEPALARWQYRPAGDAWLARLSDTKAPRRSLVLAIEGLAALREEGAADRLRELVLSDGADQALRVTAARALGALRTEGLEKDAESLSTDATARGIPSRLAAAQLLQRHRNEQAVRQLQRLAEDTEPAVASLAVGRLIEIDPKFVVPALERLIASPDARLRSLAAEVLFREPSENHLRLLADRLNDVHPDVRVKAREHLLKLAGQPDMRNPVIDEGTRILAANQWQGQEQAAILLTQLDHKAAAARLVALLKASRAEVYVTAAWGLRRLAVAETLPDVLSYVKAEQRRFRGAASRPDAGTVPHDHQLSQLNQFLGQAKYQPAAEVLAAFIPRMEPPMASPVGPECRAAAIWALGMIHQGKADAGYVAALKERLNDVRSLPPEDPRVRWMCAVTFGRLGAKDALDSLRRFCPDFEVTQNRVNNACGWAIERLTGETLPAPKTIRKTQRDWFLLPDK